jgi:hypothetical protein
MLTMEAWKLKMEPWKVCRAIIADSLKFYEEAGSGSAFMWKAGSGSPLK